MKQDPKLQTTPYDIPSHASLSQKELEAQTSRFRELKEELATVFSGDIALRGDDIFAQSVRIFNDAAPLGGWLVALPESAQDISKVIRFCNRHSLSPSIRSGGFATAGWAIQGDVIIDTRRMADVKLSFPPQPTLIRDATVSGPVAGISTLDDTSVVPPSPQIAAKKAGDCVYLSADSVAGIDRAAQSQLHGACVKSFQDDLSRLGAVAGSSDTAPYVSGARIRKADEAFSDAGSHSSRPENTPQQSSPALLRRRTADERMAHLPLDTFGAPIDRLRDASRNSTSMQKGRSGESGADADSESSSGRSNSDVQGQQSASPCTADASGGSDRPKGGVGADYMTGSVPRDQALMLSNDKAVPGSQPPASWVDRQIDPRGLGSASPSGSGSGSGSGSTHSSNTTSVTYPNGSESLSTKPVITSAAPRSTLQHQQLAYQAAGGSADRSESPMMIDGNSPRPRSRTASVAGSASGSSRGGRQSSQSQTPDDWDPTSSSEHKRWQKHHRPEGTTGDRITLPAGGFVWRSDGDVTMSSSVPRGKLPWDSAAFAASEDNINPEPSYTWHASDYMGSASAAAQQQHIPSFAASSLADLQDAWPSNVWTFNTASDNAEAGSSLPRFIPSPLQSTTQVSPMQEADGANLYSFAGRANVSPSTAAAILPPGVHEDKFALVSFGPGAGIRGLDAFTDKAGREGTFDAGSEDGARRAKGKARSDDTPKTLVVNGVPYHVPVSAYPVGSTAMTTGGFGYLTRAYGLSLDNIVEVEMVLADGRIVTLNEDSKKKSDEERELWWAVRGAAPCFGVVSRIVAKAYPVPSVYSGNLIYPLNPATAGSLIRHWRDCLKAGLPNAFYSNLILTAGPSKTSHVIVIQVCFLGPKSEGEALVQAISSWTGERTLLKDVEERSFLNQQDGVAKVLKGGSGRRWMVRGDLISTLTDEMIAKSVRSFQGLGSRAVWLFELLGGAVEDVGEDETCISRNARAAKFTVGSLQQWSGQAEDQKCIQSVERWLNEIVSKVSIGGPYPCFLGRSERLERVVGAYGPRNFRRLMKLKKQVDPNGLFRNTLGHGLVMAEEEVEEVLARLEDKEAQLAAQEAGV